MLYRILGGIYLSSFEPLNNRVNLKDDYNISHILSVLPGPIPEIYKNEYTHKQIEVTDEETTNLLQYFNETNEFIDKALYSNEVSKEEDKNKMKSCVLIHCAQGVSRSVTIIVAYLMFKHNLKLEQALYAVKRKFESAEPNPSFLEQLKLFEKMGKKVEVNSQEYRLFTSEMLLKQDPSGNSLKDATLSQGSKEINPVEENSFNLRCKKCRQVLALESQLEFHEPPTADSRQSRFKRLDASNNCSHFFFVEPVEWMRDELENKGEIEGKFQCPKCTSKVGGYSWKGSRCSCGKWMVPAIHLQSAKVDKIKKLQ